jgi:hypothetical protein
VALKQVLIESVLGPGRIVEALVASWRRPGRFPVGNFLQLLGKMRAFFRHCRGVPESPIKEFCGRVEQLADTQVSKNILTANALCDPGYRCLLDLGIPRLISMHPPKRKLASHFCRKFLQL